MLNLRNSIFLIATELIDFDPDVLDVGMSFLAVAGKYAMIFGISAFLLRMVIRAGTGKERFI